MAHLNRKQIRELAREIVKQNSGGIRYSQIHRQISEAHPETPKNSITGALYNWELDYPNEIIKPDRGLYRVVDGELLQGIAQGNGDSPKPSPSLQEVNFYEPFAEYLCTDLDEALHAEALGGNGLRAKWGTPDVVGVYKPTASNLIKFPIEIISAEIKLNPQNPVEAFGQAVAYRLFSTKTYVVMPSSMSEEDQSRLETLCLLYGIGLVVFAPNVGEPDFSVRVRAQRFSPDMFYVNEFADRLRAHNPEKFEKLFG